MLPLFQTGYVLQPRNTWNLICDPPSESHVAAGLAVKINFTPYS